MALKFRCPKCSSTIISRFCRRGEIVNCRKCDTKIAIPEDAESTDDESTLIMKSGSVVEEEVDKTVTEAEILKGRRYPGFLQAVWLLVLMLVLQIVLTFPVTCVAFLIRRPLHMHPVTIPIISTIVMLLVLRIGYNNTRVRFHEVFLLSPIRTLLLLPFVITLIGYSIIHNGLISVVVKIFPVVTEHSQYSVSRYMFDFVYRNPVGATMVLLISVPFLEEALFRGVILRGFLYRYTTRKAILVSSLLFAVYHINVFLVLHAFVLGLILAWWFVKTKSLLPCILGHFFCNSLALVSISMFSPATRDEIESAAIMPWWLFLCAVLIFVFGILLAKRMLGQTNPNAGTGSSPKMS